MFRPAGQVRARVFALGCICALAVAPVAAEQGSSAKLGLAGTAAPAEEPGERSRAFAPTHSSRFASRVQFQMEAMSTFTKTSAPGRELHDNLMYDEFSQAVERDLVRSTRRALRDYLMEVTAVNELLERMKHKSMLRVGLEGGGDTAGGRARNLGFGFGISSLRPSMDMDYEVGRSSFRFSLDGSGSVGLRYRNPRLGGNVVSAGYNGEDAYYLSWQIGGRRP
jgi:hypothetical protein